MAIQLLRVLAPSYIVAADVDDAKLEQATALGAHDVVNNRNGADAAERIRRITGPRGAGLVLDCVGVQPTIDLGATLLGRNSVWTIVGLGGGHHDFRHGGTPYGVSVSIPCWGSRVELMEVIAMARSGAIHAETTEFPLEQAADVYQKLKAGRDHGPRRPDTIAPGAGLVQVRPTDGHGPSRGHLLKGCSMQTFTSSTPGAHLPCGIPPHGYRLPFAAHPGGVHLQVADLQRSLAYYGGVLGLRTLDTTAASAVLGAQGDAPPLVTLTEKPGIVRARRGAFGLCPFRAAAAGAPRSAASPRTRRRSACARRRLIIR